MTKASPGDPADINGNRVACAYCDRVATVRIKEYTGSVPQPRQSPDSGFMTVAEVREGLAKGTDVGEPRCLRHLNGAGELSEAAQREASGAANLREKTA